MIFYIEIVNYIYGVLKIKNSQLITETNYTKYFKQFLQFVIFV